MSISGSGDAGAFVPRIGISMGDPSGVGPELVVRALAEDGSEGTIVFGDRGLLAETARRLGLPLPPRIVSLTSLPMLSPPSIQPAGGQAQVAYLEALVAAAERGELDALCTAPINKHACQEAGFAFPGHTEFLAARLPSVVVSGVAPGIAMMIAGPHLRVVPATIHVALAKVPAMLSRDLAATLVLTVRALHDDFSVDQPRVAVCGLNPHAGEFGAFGDEEQRLIAPAIAAARETLSALSPTLSFLLTGPHVPDAVFRAAAKPPFGDGLYDAVVGMYHDQALIPVKMIDFDDAVNVTLGLSIPRTSPDHGVAYEVAGTNRVRAGSFRAALKLARELARKRRSPA